MVSQGRHVRLSQGSLDVEKSWSMMWEKREHPLNEVRMVVWWLRLIFQDAICEALSGRSFVRNRPCPAVLLPASTHQWRLSLVL